MKEHEPPRLFCLLNHSLNPGSWATISNLFRSYFSQMETRKPLKTQRRARIPGVSAQRK